MSLDLNHAYDARGSLREIAEAIIWLTDNIPKTIVEFNYEIALAGDPNSTVAAHFIFDTIEDAALFRTFFAR